MINFASPLVPNYDEYCKIVKNIFDTKIFTNHGPKVTELEKKLEIYFSSNVSLFCNGTIALMSAIKILNLEGEIITPAYTFPATMNSISLCGCTPIFCDINNIDLTIDTDKIESLITEKTSAILAVHVYGNLCNNKKIEELANKYNLKIIYDAAHCFDVPECANYGDISMFSFHPTKLFHTSEGGCLTTKDKNTNEDLKLFRGFGICGEEDIRLIGLNGKMNELSASMGLLNLEIVQKEIECRQKIRKLYEELLYINNIDVVHNKNKSVSYFVIRIKNKRNNVYIKLKDNGIIARKYFYPLLTNKGIYKTENNLEISNLVSEEVLALPFYGSLTEGNIIQICNIIKEVMNND